MSLNARFTTNGVCSKTYNHIFVVRTNEDLSPYICNVCQLLETNYSIPKRWLTGPLQKSSPPGSNLCLRHWLWEGDTFRLAPGRHIPTSGPCIRYQIWTVASSREWLDKWSVGTAHLRTFEQSCKRASFWSPKPAQARNRKPEPGPSPSLIFEAQFSPESQIYRVSWGMCNYGVTKNVVYGHSCRFKVLSHPK